MAISRSRTDYLDEYNPGDASELLKGSRFAQFFSLPNDFGDLSGRFSPTYTSAFFDSLSKFKPKTEDDSTHFERFLAMQRNPDYLVERTAKMPAGFNQAYGLMSSFSN